MHQRAGEGAGEGVPAERSLAHVRERGPAARRAVRFGVEAGCANVLSVCTRCPLAPSFCRRGVAEVDVRTAADRDLDEMVALMYAEPGVEQVAFMPSLSGAPRFTRTLWQLAGMHEFLVVDDGGDVLGFAWRREQGISIVHGARAAVAGWGLAGPVRLTLKGWPRQLVELPMPPGPKLVELQVHPTRRGTGVGTTLLRAVIDEVGGRSLSLTTRSDNPARHLYERHGFAVTAEKCHRSYERRTGSRGRILMVRRGTTT